MKIRSSSSHSALWQRCEPRRDARACTMKCRKAIITALKEKESTAFKKKRKGLFPTFKLNRRF